MGYTPGDDGRATFATLFGDGIEGGDIRLRHGREDDVPALVGLVDDEMRRWLHLPEAVDEAFARAMTLHGGILLIIAVATDTPLGGIRMFLHGDAVEFGYWLGPAARGRGVATRALGLVSDAVVAHLRPARLELRTTVGNSASERVAERAGYRRVGPEPPIEFSSGRVMLTTLYVRELE